ncbi:MAG: hypothetical protein P5702_11545 [Limnospira sp. PMC 1291.21]|uniref:hypothetical protein n=1 Tax=unclassified Limnospira TaxID=2642885 RepID=UPI0028E0DF0D|nr:MULTISPECIES: hypothetical protein [unclassified Limnospira]MDT9178102.1 hypothetical protein [Limnospira sp. PMC 1238.20]MDT9193336.1 hypothetical protein [Limnospira sp. PMC 1245.20]MDT9203637.1 hypothetical protein [Limnospira sp. PMC 1243.20]MDT9208776.1 hypothetical protein [Limnospira sp. PMC 1252.20]MDT9213973.1 hypothetical protein [Limnospira sp. PMC 1256.20]
MIYSVSIPENITFEDAIAITQSLIDQSQAGSISDSDLAAAISKLVHSENGARGFFVTYLTDTRPIPEQMTPEIQKALESSPEIVSELLVKNLAMSAAMVVYHHRHQNEDMAASSDLVRSRCIELIQSLNLPPVKSLLQQLLETSQTGEGPYQDFLERWGYDTQQREAIATSVHLAIA